MRLLPQLILVKYQLHLRWIRYISRNMVGKSFPRPIELLNWYNVGNPTSDFVLNFINENEFFRDYFNDSVDLEYLQIYSFDVT